MRPLVAGLQGIFVDEGRGCVQRKGPRQIYRQVLFPTPPLKLVSEITVCAMLLTSYRASNAAVNH